MMFPQFLELVQEDQKADLIEGVLFMASPENIEHNDLVGWLNAVLREYVEHRELGRVTVNRVAYRVSDRSAPEPDIGFIDVSRAHIIRSGYVDGPPDVAIEVVSPDSMERDYRDKRTLYERAGVREYWLIDPDERHVLLLQLENGAFTETRLAAGVLRSAAIPGFWLDASWLWASPLPRVRPVVDTLLAGASA